jgi:hypothetical protein
VSARVWTVGGRTTPAALSARLAAGLGAERMRRRLPSCSISLSVRESRSARMAGQEPWCGYGALYWRCTVLESPAFAPAFAVSAPQS